MILTSVRNPPDVHMIDAEPFYMSLPYFLEIKDLGADIPLLGNTRGSPFKLQRASSLWPSLLPCEKEVSSVNIPFLVGEHVVHLILESWR
ncbi:hypothetical protein KY284_012759 [Solanum tuberosum]|nr:hypothetical protein KY284_012759 [Solanum tuberosum]